MNGQNPETSAVSLAELPSRGNTFTDITLDQFFIGPGGVKWDGRYLAVAGGTSKIYRFKIKGHRGTEVGATPIAGSKIFYPFWLQAGNVYVPGLFSKFQQANVRFYHYPKGGNAFKRLIGFTEPFGVAVSESK